MMDFSIGMRALVISTVALFVIAAGGCNAFQDSSEDENTHGTPLAAGHAAALDLWGGAVPESAIQHAKDTLHIGYGHTSHGSQITDGMTGLVEFANAGNLGRAYSTDLFAWSHDGAGGALHLFEGDGYGDGPLDHDAGYYPDWVEETRAFLDNPTNAAFNIIMWSWCGQLSGYSSTDLHAQYLYPMSQLEAEYPQVTFVYMTGHLDGTGETGNLARRNQEIRQFCAAEEKWLFDFAEIESYDPDGAYYLDRGADDACGYDSDGDGSDDANWAQAWQDTHTEGTDWYSCGSAHSEPLNANMKAYAAWWLFARIAGWEE